MDVRPYEPEHRDEMRAVCLATGNERVRVDETYACFSLLMYCDPYLDHGTAFMLVDDEGCSKGYALASEAWPLWRRDFAPYRQRIEALGQEYADRVANETSYYERVADIYPCHLHIDIVEAYTGGGHGRRLMETLLDELRAQGVSGVSFGVSAKNERAIGFYQHLGFERLEEFDAGSGYTFGMRF